MTWWQDAVLYEIYPRSFRDSNGDGVGDISGIVEKLDYLAWLGVDAIWVAPIYPSPMKDFGYDISDYTGVDPLFGTLADLDRLIAETHRRGMKLLLDLVPNHTSDRHPWFLESRASRDSPKRDWYIWRDPAPGGGPPNNWMSTFGGSGWEFDPPTGQYYYHAFLKEQPDLNWRNPDVRRAMSDVVRFWFERGVDGFRIDVLWHIVKDDQFRDNPENPNYRPGQHPTDRYAQIYTCDRPEVHDVIVELRAVADAFPERVLIGEIYLPIERLVAYYGKDLRGVHLPFNFQLLGAPWQAEAIARIIREYEGMLPPGAWPNWVLGNHDKSRIASRVGAAQARVAAVLLLTLRGTATVYYGDELGLADVPVPPEMRQDPIEAIVPGTGRDPCRSPMPWDGSAHAGFSTARPWLPLTADAAAVNVAAQADDPRSMLSLHRRLIALRRQEPALRRGTYQPVLAEGEAFAYARRLDRRAILCALNLAGSAATLRIGEEHGEGRILLSSHLDRDGEPIRETITLRGDEAVVVGFGSV